MEIFELKYPQANGGDVLPLDKQADIRIVDHARKEVLPGTCVIHPSSCFPNP